MKSTKQLAFCGIIAAISVTLMFISGIFSFLSYAIPGICGALLIMIVIEMGKSKALLIYLVVSIISLLIVADKTSVAAYILLLGYYPVLKSVLERIKNRVLEYALKLFVFIASAAVAITMMALLVGLEAVLSLGSLVLIGAAVLLIIAFFAYDFCLSLLSKYYINVLKPRFLKNFFR